MKINPVEIILAKRNGAKIGKEALSAFIRGYLDGAIPDYQMSALLMAIYFQGMDKDEIQALTLCYIDSGQRIVFTGDLPTADKHSTGGVGDKISLMLAPIAAACGLYVPMISGRGLGHTGGTLDKLESIPGFQTRYDTAGFQQMVERQGLAMVGQSATLVPADKMIYALRDVTATVESIGLITASIMSKKIAEGARSLVIDLKVGSGAFMPDLAHADVLAESLIDTGAGFGQKVSVVFSNMNSPLGQYVGNALEVIEAIEYLKGNPLPDTEEITNALVTQMLLNAGLATDPTQAQTKIDQVMQSGKALQKFEEMVIGQGGDPRVIENYALFDGARYEVPVKAERDGFVGHIDARQIGYALIRIHAGRMKVSDVLDYGSGAHLMTKIGNRVKAGETIGTVFANDESKAIEVSQLIRAAYHISPEPVSDQPLILKIRTSQ